MPSRFATWLLVQDFPNDDFEFFRTRLRIAAEQTNLAPRLRLSMATRNGVAMMRTSSPDGLREQVARSENGLVVFCTADLETIGQLVGASFWIKTGYICIERPPRTLLANPYWRRLLILKFGQAADFKEKQGELLPYAAHAVEDRGVAFLDPQIVELTEQHCMELFADDARNISELNVFFLPPWKVADSDEERDGESRGYFSRSRLALRKLIAEHCLGLDDDLSRTPVAAAVWRLLDDPLVSELMLDGGSIEIVGRDGGPTSLKIRLSGRDPIARYRGRFVLKPASVRGPFGGGRAVAEAISADVRGLPEVACPPEATGHDLDWSVAGIGPAEGRNFSPRAGTWKLIHDLSVKVGKAQAGPSAGLRSGQRDVDRWVLVPARNVNGELDQDLAERLFMSHLWRCPWSMETELGSPGWPWRLATLDLLREDLANGIISPEERIKNWHQETRQSPEDDLHFERRERLELREEPLGRTVVHSRNADEAFVLRWRLLMPLGTVFRSERVFRLDTPGFDVLDAGLVLE